MKYFSLITFIIGIALSVYGKMHPKEYCFDLNIKDTYYLFTYSAVGTFLVILSLFVIAFTFLYSRLKK